MIRVAIVEDEQQYIRQLTEYLQRYREDLREDISIRVFEDGEDIVENYRPQYDIILMDIQMRFMDGMTAAEEIRRVDSEVIILFITNMSQYALRGYEVGALDYIVKPIEYFAFRERLGRAIARVKKRAPGRSVTVPVKGGVLRMDVSDIYYIESQGHDLIYHTGRGVYVSGGSTMKSAEETFAPLNFFRGNKCYLINLEHVDGVKDHCAIVKGEHLLLSRPKQNQFLQALNRYWGENT